jgi:hypothetical protein
MNIIVFLFHEILKMKPSGAVQRDLSGVGYSTNSITFLYPNCSVTNTQMKIQ